MSGETFFSRWSRRKAGDEGAIPEAIVPNNLGPASEGARTTEPPQSAVPVVVRAPSEAGESGPVVNYVEPPPLDTVNPDGDFSPFMQKDIAPELRNQAMKKLFTDPHYNVMDRLDTYIDDYSKPDPMPPGMLRRLHQAKALFMFDDEQKDAPAANAAAGQTGEPARVAAKPDQAAALSPVEKLPQPKVEE